jgi:CubicO group peptidase (beta-lactamase class C family)
MTAHGKHGFDAARLNRIDGFLKARYLDSGKLPHAQILISREGEIAHFSSQGAAREGSSKAIDEGSIFRIASMTKPITSVAFMMLVEEGKVSVDTPVADILPEFRDVGVYNGGGAGVPFLTKAPAEPMRMLDLLRHTSGLTYGFQNRSNVDAAYRTTRSNAGPVENWHGEHDLDGFIADLAKTPWSSRRVRPGTIRSRPTCWARSSSACQACRWTASWPRRSSPR